jgi:hypothetical protein
LELTNEGEFFFEVGTNLLEHQENSNCFDERFKKFNKKPDEN